jgi:hypothetical protein
MKKQGYTTRKSGVAWRIAGLLLIIGLLLGLNLHPVLAQTYKFSVPESTADVYVNSDGTVSIDYYYLFQNSPSADPIDIVDVGMPTDSYNMGSITATIDGKAVQQIAESQYVHPGVEIHLGSGTIQPGKSGKLRVHVARIDRMLFKASAKESEAYGSFQYTPNYYSSEFVSGQTKMTVTLHLPPGLKENEPRYFTPKGWPGAAEPESGFDEENRVFYRWTSNNASSSAQYVFGASFPARLVPASALLTEVPFQFNTDTLCPIFFCLGFAGFIVFVIWASMKGDRARKLQYLPPKVAVEGNGIKRGLTAVEAALLMQQPMDKILTMILFSVIKKGAASVVIRDPMKLQIVDPLPEDLRTYEKDFLTAMALEKSLARRSGLQNMMTDLVKSVSEKMRGFSRKETMDYYQDIMNKAWQQVEQAQTPEMKMQMFDDAMDWTMLDKRYDDHTRDVFGPRPVIVPMWWGRYDPTFSRPSSASTASIPSISTGGNRPPQGMSMPNLPGSDFASSMVAGMQTFSSKVVGDLTTFTSGVTNKTNPIPVSTSSGTRGGGGGGGGRSCACACACAGCACACAGGGR